MNLVENIKTKRVGMHKKRAFKKTLFDRIGIIVSKYHLGDDFLKRLDDPVGKDFGKDLLYKPLKLQSKMPLDLPLFTLLSGYEFRISVSIIRAIIVPYINFVHTPDEILLCQTLYGCNSNIAAKRLEKCHFATLLVYELARRQVGELSRKIRAMHIPTQRVADTECMRLDALSKQFAHMRALTETIEKIKF